MKKLIILCLTIVVSTITFAQETTISSNINTESTNKSRVLIIPFEANMFISDINRDLATKNKENIHEIKARFRAALDREIFIALKKYYQPFSFYSIEPGEAKQELGYIYNSIGYKYELVPKEEVVEKENVAKKVFNKLKKKEKEEEYLEAKVHNGEIISQVDNREKYMKAVLSNEKLLTNLNKRYETKYYIFINELDIKKGADDVYQASEELYKREVKVHYTIYDLNGKEMSSGAIKTRFPSGQNDVDKIIKGQFPLIAQRIVEKLASENIMGHK